MRSFLVILALATTSGCESATVRCNRAKLEARTTWSSATDAAKAQYVAINGDCFVYGERPCSAFKGDHGAASAFLRQLLAFRDAAASAQGLALERAVAAHEAGEVALREALPIQPLLDPGTSQAIERARAATSTQWNQCKDVEP